MPKKSLGQNFLKSTKAISDIVASGRLSKNDTVLEIGPGKGALTEKLLETGAKVVAVEADGELIQTLQEKFSVDIEKGKLELIHGDILEISIKDLKLKKYKIIANIPYYITGAIIRKFLEANLQPELMVLLVQKEVAERIVARDGKQSILSISVQAYGEPKYIAKVSARYFTPAPKVDSSIIHIANISKKNFQDISEENFFQVVKLAFGQKRKTLLKNLNTQGRTLGVKVGGSTSYLEIFGKLGISAKARAEDLSFEKILALAKAIHARPNGGDSGRFPQTTNNK